MSSKQFTLSDIAELTKSKLVGNPTLCITNVADLENADYDDASFLANPRYEQAMQKSRAGVIFISPTTPHADGRNYLINENPSRAFQELVDAMFSERLQISDFKGIHHTAIIDPSCQIGSNVTICPYAVIEKNTVIGSNSFIGSGCYIGPFTTIGEDCILHPQVVVRERATIGNRVILQPGAVIGSCGFGYTTDSKGKHTKLNQVGTVTIEDDVEIGANTTIDRSRFKTTRIGQGTKIDNLVQIGHGAIIGSFNLIVAQVGVSGSAETGRNVILAGQSALAGHIKIANGAILSARTGATKSIVKAGKYGGLPAIPLEAYNRNQVLLRNIESLVDEVKALKKRLDAIEN